MAKNMSGTKSCTRIPTLQSDGKNYDTSEAKAELIAQKIAEISSDDNYTENFNNHRKEDEEKWKLEDQENGDHSQNDDMKKLNQDFAIYELQHAIRLSKNGSAPGQDKITYDLLKHQSKNAQQQLLQFFNKIWKEEEIITDWKESIILPYYKPGMERSSPGSYRPISLTATLCKINERLVTTRLVHHLE